MTNVVTNGGSPHQLERAQMRRSALSRSPEVEGVLRCCYAPPNGTPWGEANIASAARSGTSLPPWSRTRIRRSARSSRQPEVGTFFGRHERFLISGEERGSRPGHHIGGAVTLTCVGRR